MGFSSNDMYTGGQYYQKNPGWDDDYTEWKAGIIHGLLKKNHVHPKTVVEVGCGAGGVLEHLSILDKDIQQLKGFDISPDAIALAMKKTRGKLSFFNEDFTATPHEPSDLLLCIDVLEHVDDMYGFLAKIKPAARNAVFHIPLDVSCRTILKPHVMLQQRQAVGHIHYFSKEMAEWALNDCGYKILDWIYTKPAVDWERSTSIKRTIKKTLRNFSYAINKDLSAKLWGGYSIMILTA